ncbi:MAG: ATP-binding protein [Snowella sp.]|nr:ATP-binding protein [Snowella sp.]
MSETNQPRLLSFTLDGWSVLGGPVTISLNDGVAVLVGRNGAGKSAILEGLMAITSFASGRNRLRPFFDDDNIPKILEIEILSPTSRRFLYRYELLRQINLEDDLSLNSSIEDGTAEEFSWNECCQYLDQNKETIWKTESGVTTIENEDNPITVILGNTSSLQRANLPENLSLKLPSEMHWVRSVLRGFSLIGKRPTRRSSQRYPSYLRVRSSDIRVIPISAGELSSWLPMLIHRLIEKEDFDELESVCQRVGIGKKITEQQFVRTDKDKEYLLEVLLDEVNIGLLSDGTLRVLSILLEIITSSSTEMIIIEEPETQIHPGMLEKLLNEIESYTYGQNLILSTHSPQVVSWTKPDKINLVYRENGRTFVQKLGEDEIHNVANYLNEEGSLGDWIYSGILDD